MKTAIKLSRVEFPEVSRAFTLVELLVVIAIIGVMIALTLPAIQASRETANRTSCVNNMTQLGVGLHHYEMAHERLPPGTIDAKGPIRSVAKGDHRNWIIELLPYLDETNMYRHVDQTVGVYHPNNAGVRAVQLQMLICPSEFGNPGNPAPSNYAAVHHDVEAPIDVNNNGVMFLNSKIRTRDITDGLAHTIFVGETDLDPLGWMSGTRATLRNAGSGLNAGARTVVPWPAPAPNSDDSSSAGEATLVDQAADANANAAAAAGNPTPQPQAAEPTRTRNADVDQSLKQEVEDKAQAASQAGATANNPAGGNSALFVGGFSSCHPAGVNFLFGDGSVRFIPETINQQILQQLANRADGKLPAGGY